MVKKDTLERKIDRLTHTVGKRFDRLEKSMEAGFAAVAEDIADLRTNMATKDQLLALSLQVHGIEQELKSIRIDLDDLAKRIGDIPEYRKDIDLLYKKIARIEKYLATYKKTAA